MMKKNIFLLIVILITGCSSGQKEQEIKQTVYTHGNTSENSIKSAEKIDNNITYEVFFSLESSTECLNIEIESVYLQKTFPVQKIPKKTFFIVEKEIILPAAATKNKTRYIPIGRNFNNDWEIFSPVKICTLKNDPLSVLNKAKYRIRLTTFEKLPVYYVITINSDSKVVFAEGK